MPSERPISSRETTQGAEHPLFQKGKERLTNPDLALIHVTEIKGVPGVKYDIAVVRDPYHSALGGWRIKSSELLMKDYQKAQREDSENVRQIMRNRDIPDEIAAAGVLESFELAGEMALKWAGMRSTMRYGMDDHSRSYGKYRDDMLSNRDAWLNSSKMDGGTKGILVITDPEAYKHLTVSQRDNLLEQHAKHMIELNKRKPKDAADDVAYYTAPDMGSSEAMMDKISEYTGGRFVACYSEENGGTGNPSPTTALGVAYGTRAMVDMLSMREDGRGVTFAVQGAAGEVGHDLVKFLRRNHSGAQIVVADMDPSMEQLIKLKTDYDAKIVDKDEIHTAGNIFVPSGPAQQLNHETLPKMRAAEVKAVVGPANYLWIPGREEELAEEFRAANIVVAPAPLVNQGGIRSILPQFVEQITGRRPAQEVAHESVRDVQPMTVFVLRDAQVRNVTPDQVFQEIAYDEYGKHCEAKGLI